MEAMLGFSTSGGTATTVTMGYEFNFFGESTSIIGKNFRTYEVINDNLTEKEIPKPKADKKTWWMNLGIGVAATVGLAVVGVLVVVTAPVTAPAALIGAVAGLAFGASLGAAYATVSTAINDKVSGVVTETKDFVNTLLGCIDAGAQIGFSVGSFIGGGIDTYYGLKSLIDIFRGGMGGGAMALAGDGLGYGIQFASKVGENAVEVLTSGGMALEGLLAMAVGGKGFSDGTEKAKEEVDRQNAKDETEGNKSDGGSGSSKGEIESQYSGKLEQVSKPDPAADALAERINGQSRVKYSNDPSGREFDAISDEYIAQAKPALSTVNKSVRNQMKATFEAAKATGKKVYYQFEGQPAQSVIDKLYEYSERYGIDVIIDTKPLGVTN